MRKVSITLFSLILTLMLIACTDTSVVNYQVDFVVNGGSAVTSLTVPAGNAINPPTTSRDGYRLLGWFRDNEFTEEWIFATHRVNSDITLYAQWELIPTPQMSISEYVQELLTSEYASPSLSALYGLNQPTEVGVIEDEIMIVYNEIPDSEFNASAIFDFEAAKINHDLSDTAAWDYVIEQAKTYQEQSQNPVKIKLPSRDIDIIAGASSTATSNYALSIVGFDGLHIAGGEDTVIMIEIQAVWKAGLLISDSSNVQINQVMIDYKYTPTITGIIKAYDTTALTITMNIPLSMHETVAYYQSVPELASTLHSFVEYNMFTGGPKENGNILINSQGMFKNITLIDNQGSSEDQIIVEFAEGYRNAFKTPRINDRVALGFAMYGNNGISVQDSEEIILESSGIYTAPGMGLTANQVHNLYINRFRIMLKDERLMTVTADGMHISNSTGKVEITNSLIENTHDDALNIKSGYYYSLSSVDAVTRTITLARKTSSIPLPKVGDKIAIYGSSDFDHKATFTVSEVSGTAALMQIKVVERIAGTIDWTNAVATNISFSAELVFKNNIVRNKRNRGILVQVRQALIENNSFENIGHGSIMVSSSLDIYNEATMPDNITVKNNKFINNGYLLLDALRGDVSVFAQAEGGKVAPSGTISNVTIENNFIANTANTGVSLRGVGNNVVVGNNLFYNTARVYSSNLTEAAVELYNVTNISIINNYNYYTLGSLTYSGIIPSGLTKTDTIVLQNNVNMNYQTIDGETQTYHVSQINDSEIVIDGDMSDWMDRGTDIVLDGSSLATGDEISYETYQNVFHVKTAKIAYSDTGIYIAFDIFDNRLEYKSINDFWLGDVAEIFLSTYLDSPNADFMLYKEEANVFQLAIAPTWNNNLWFAAVRTTTSIVNNKASVQAKAITYENGWSGEVYLPFTVIPEAKAMIDDGIGIPIAIVFADAERNDINRTRLQVGNVPHFVEAFKTKTAKMPLYIFGSQTE